MLLIFSPQTTERLHYVLQLFFGELVKTPFQVTGNREAFESFDGAKFSYGKARCGNELFIAAADLLFENELVQQEINTGIYEGVKTIFHHNTESDLPFDPFAAAFYLVTRYEEYLPFTTDAHGRFPDKQNIAFLNDFHEIPVVNHYALLLMKLLQQRFPALSFELPAYRFLLTYDIDFAFAWRNKGWLRNAVAYWRSLKRFDGKEIIFHTQVLAGSRPDPFDTFTFQKNLHSEFDLKPVYFFLLADFGQYDKNINPRNKEFTRLIRNLAAEYGIGMHASYASNTRQEKVAIEKQRLEAITGAAVFRNRQHFLKLRFPDTYRNLIDHGITEDYTMGFAAFPGFRAGIASPFFWFDVEQNRPTGLRIFPFVAMDATFHYYRHLHPEAALEKCKELIDAVRKVQGVFQLLAHNDLLSMDGEWSGWREKFEALIAYGSRA